jgi:hypothetical protein
VIGRLGRLIERLKEGPAEDEERRHGILDDIEAGRVPPDEGCK